MKRLVTHLSLCLAAAVLAAGCTPVRHNLPPEQRMLEPGPGVGGPGPGVLGPPAMAPPGGGMPMGAMPGMAMPGMGCPPPMAMNPAGQGTPMPAGDAGADANGEIAQVQYCGPGGGAAMAGGMMPGMMGPPPTVQVTFSKPESMHVRYSVSGPGMFDSEPLVVPARQNFPQGGLYRLKLTNIINREGVELYPTLELAYANPRTGAYLAHNAIPVQFTEEDLDQVLTGNFVTKVIYLPDPDFQGPALAGIDTLVSTRLDPGVDPIVEADSRGSILAIIRLGDKDIEMAQGVDAGYAGGMAMAGGLPMPFAPSASCGNDGCETGGMASRPPALPGMISGVNMPQYGMPSVGTPIGLPGPPHIPLGAPAGLKKHVMKNRTHMHMPQPVDKVNINVRQAPGYSYPNPVSRINVTEHNIHPGVPYGRPVHDRMSQNVDGTNK
ncbi:hypothetical protein [Roseimaritima ulvae]|uniref:Uncharacterized protein n=1 Tax=Roseimaritima ulvae TaxID=980254 RepID=A0A5B9QMC9_9BACT|nr:hypothetical protein [Roseimaritima ulvae]QEG39002.1 hypothetical protein UC8_09630 [Roseimaritima ulvae]